MYQNFQKGVSDMKKEKFNWIPCNRKLPYNGQRVLLSFADEKQGPLVGTWKVDEEGGAFYDPFTGRTYASLCYFVTAWMPLPEPYRESEGTEKQSLDNSNGNINYECPLCGIQVITDAEGRSKYCGECGCKFDWGEINET